MLDNIIGKDSKVYAIVTKVVELVCCQKSCRKSCEELCDCCLPPKKPPRLTKADIQHLVHQQPSSGVGLCADTPPTASPSFSGAETYSFTSRERLDSDHSCGSSVSTASRKDSPSAAADYRKPAAAATAATPVIDMKPIEFWAATNREAVQPRAASSKRMRLQSETDVSVDSLNVDLYEVAEKNSDDTMTDAEKLARYQLGQVHLSIQYEIPSKCLLVRIIEARHLAPPLLQDASRTDMAHSNPYAKVALLPDDKNTRQTTVQRKTQSPAWAEVFRFEMAFREAQKRTLEVTIKDFDKYSRHCAIGQVLLKLDNINLIKGGHMWKPLMPSTKETPELGELLLSLNYLPTAGRLSIDVIKAKQLIQTDLVGGSDPYIKVTLCQDHKSVKSKKTSVKKNTIDPVFNESLTFNLTPDQLASTSFVVTVWDYNSKSRDDFVGRIVLGKHSTGADETAHWTQMLQCQRTPVAQWHTLHPRAECDSRSAVSPAVP